METIPTTARCIFDAFITTVNSDTASFDSKMAVLLADGEKRLRDAGLDARKTMNAFAESLAMGNACAHAIPKDSARMQLRMAKENPSLCPLSPETVDILLVLIDQMDPDDRILRGNYSNYATDQTISKKLALKEGEVVLASLENPTDSEHITFS